MTNKDVITRWVAQSGPRGKAGNLSFEGDTLYSYSTAVARRVVAPKGICLLITDRRCSVTTQQHIGLITWTCPKFEVASINGCHVTNLRKFHSRLVELKTSLETRRVLNTRRWDRTKMDVLKDTVVSYCEMFDLPVPEEFRDIGAFLAANLNEKVLLKVVGDALAA